MRFPAPLVEGRLITRYKRFLADIALVDGTQVTAHCANPGAMLGLTAPGSRVFLSRWDRPSRAHPYSWELVDVDHGGGPHLVGINTSNPNRIAAEAIAAGSIPTLAGYATLRREVKYGRASRVDFLLTDPERPPCYVEVKNVHLMREPDLAEFPDCVTARGARHLDELGGMVEAGCRSVMLFVVQMEAQAFALAADLDATYAAAFERATARGVETLVAVCRVTTEEVVIVGTIPLRSRLWRSASLTPS